MFFSRFFHIIRTNVQTNQIIVLISILLMGIFYFQINFSIEKLLVVFGTTSFFEILYSRIKYGTWSFPYSGIPAGFGISFFLRTDSLILYILAGFLAISSKYIFRIQDKHFFNPSNFWVFVVLALFPYITWTNPLQWWLIHKGFDLYLLYAALIVLWFFMVWRVYVNKKINLLYIIIPFIITHLLIVVTLSHESWLSYRLIYAPSFFIFTFYMITDPQTVLGNIYSRIAFGSLVAVWFFVLQFFINENYSILASLFICTIIIPIIRYFDDKKVYNNMTLWNVIIYSLLFILISILFTLIYIHGSIDIVFDNRCRALFCI